MTRPGCRTCLELDIGFFMRHDCCSCLLTEADSVCRGGLPHASQLRSLQPSGRSTHVRSVGDVLAGLHKTTQCQCMSCQFKVCILPRSKQQKNYKKTGLQFVLVYRRHAQKPSACLEKPDRVSALALTSSQRWPSAALDAVIGFKGHLGSKAFKSPKMETSAG